MRYSFFALTLMAISSLAQADPPKVLADIAPVHSLVAMVMDTVDAPSLWGDSDTALGEVDLLIWVSPDLTTTLTREVQSRADGIHTLTLIELPGQKLRRQRQGAGFAKLPPDQAAGAVDPHLWLDPDNAVIWLRAISDRLSQLDPANRNIYHYNATKAAATLRDTAAQMAALLTLAQDAPLVTYRDTYQYFESAFGLTIIGALAQSDGSLPDQDHRTALRKAFAQTPPRCFLIEPDVPARLLLSLGRMQLLRAGKTKVAIAQMDPFATSQERGKSLYPVLILSLAQSISDCVAD